MSLSLTSNTPESSQYPDWATEAIDNPQDESSIYLLFLRDLLLAGSLLVLTLILINISAKYPNVIVLALSSLVAIVAGIYSTFRVHEWGHLIPARLLGTLTPTKSITNFGLMNTYDFIGANRTEFFISSIGGSVFHWIYFLLLYTLVPELSLITKALLFGSFFIASNATLIEIPIMLRTLKGDSAFESFAAHILHEKRNKKITTLLSLICATVFTLSI